MRWWDKLVAILVVAALMVLGYEAVFAREVSSGLGNISQDRANEGDEFWPFHQSEETKYMRGCVFVHSEQHYRPTWVQSVISPLESIAGWPQAIVSIVRSPERVAEQSLDGPRAEIGSCWTVDDPDRIIRIELGKGADGKLDIGSGDTTTVTVTGGASITIRPNNSSNTEQD